MIKVDSVSIIDIFCIMKNGIAILLSVKLGQKIYEFIFWFNAEDQYMIIADDNFLTHYQIEDFYDYMYYRELAIEMNNAIQNKNELLKQYGFI